MNYSAYKKGVIDQNYKNSNNYLLKRESDTFLTIYQITIDCKYRQSKIFLSAAQISNLYVGLFVDGDGIINGTYIKKVESNYIVLSTFILKEGSVKLSFKCKLTSKQRWLDWNKETWKNKIEESSEKINFKEFKRADNYYLRVKNYYDAGCKRKNYYVYKDPPTPLQSLNCGDYANPLDPSDTLYCGQYKNGLDPEGPLFCGFYQNGEDSQGNLACQQYQNSNGILSQENCDEIETGN
jgi:hypothetical protein